MSMQYIKSTGQFFSAALRLAFSLKWTRGKPYMDPSMSLHVTLSISLHLEVRRAARSPRPSIIPSLSRAYVSTVDYDSLPSRGGSTISYVAI